MPSSATPFFQKDAKSQSSTLKPSHPFFWHPLCRALFLNSLGGAGLSTVSMPFSTLWPALVLFGFIAAQIRWRRTTHQTRSASHNTKMKVRSHMARTATKYRGWQLLGPKTPGHNSSRRVQVKSKTSSRHPKNKFQDHATTRQQHVMILTCRGFSYGSAIFLDPLTATSLDHLHTWVQENYQTVQVTYNNMQDNPKNRAVETVDKLNCTTTTTVKLLHQSPMSLNCTTTTTVKLLHQSPMSPHVSTACKWHQLVNNANSWHQLHNNENKHQMNWHQKKLRFQKFSTVQRSTNILTASAVQLNGFWKLDNPDN